MMSSSVGDEACKKFWSKFSKQCDNRTMMLNASADQIEAPDRCDILDDLPDLTGMDIVEVGSGIGRFTGALAQSASSVLATDFIEDFVETNQKRNAERGNISYRICSATDLKLKESRQVNGEVFASVVDFVFTNWLLMYLSNEEVIAFLQKTLEWLRPNGYMHIRESCTHASSGSTTDSLHSTQEDNPTQYRYSSVYMQLFRNIRYKDKMGHLYEFELLWASSVPTYIIPLDQVLMKYKLPQHANLMICDGCFLGHSVCVDPQHIAKV
ncbi:unnamed protein product [Gongylonema pulchrum]|uniref:phosphoethanolamine N-methyltransferase n=1 Tax=Gongylonema pulchrum TaxID=637853 RepID=A0A183CWK4_9BILA|nr:unnamed protein product [Gongylonema pulchrum]